MKNPILLTIVANENRMTLAELKVACDRQGIPVSGDAMRSLQSGNQVAEVDGRWIVLEWWKFLSP